MTEGNNCSNCFGETHKHPVKYICERKTCRNNMLCLLCFQTHALTLCEAKYGEGIKEIVDTPVPQQLDYETVDENEDPTTIRSRDYINKQEAIKRKCEEQIRELLLSEANIHHENNNKLNQLREFCERLFQEITEKWISEQKELLRKRSESTKPEVFARLEGLQGTLENMQFDYESLVRNFTVFNELNFDIIPEAEGLIALGTETMGSMTLNEARIEDFKQVVAGFFQGIEFSSLLNKERFDYKITGLLERSGEVQKLKDEIKGLDAAVRVLGARFLEVEALGPRNEDLEKQVKSLNTEKENLGKAKDDEKVALTAKIEELTRSLEDLGKAKEVEIDTLKAKVTELTKSVEELGKAKEELVKAKGVLETEKAPLLAKIEKLTKQVEGLQKEKADLEKAKDEKVTLTAKIAELTKSLEDLGKAREAEIAPLKAKVEELTKSVEDLGKAKKELVKAKGVLETEKAPLTAKSEELTKQVEALKKEKADLEKAKNDLGKAKDDEKAAIEKAKEAEKTTLTQKKEAEKTVLANEVAELTKQVEALKKENADLMKAKVDLGKKKDAEKAAEKAPLTAKVTELTKKVEVLTKENEELVKAKGK